ncbi:hypothetical protein [Legionella sp. WA2024007413]
MPNPIYSGQYVYYYDDFPNQVDVNFIPLPPEKILPTITSEDDEYSIESTRYSEYLSKIKVQCDDKMAWMMSAVPSALDSLEERSSLRQLCEYLNTAAYWKKDGDWPQQLDEEKLRAFNIEVVKNWLFQKTAHYFYTENQETLPTPNEYRIRLSSNLEQFKNELMALDALNLIRSHPDSYLVSLWDSLNPTDIPNKFNVFNPSAIIELIHEKELLLDTTQRTIHANDFEYWQQIQQRLTHELIVLINESILDELRKKCAGLNSKIPFEQLYKTNWPTSKLLKDNTPPLRSLSEVNEFMEKIVIAEQQLLRMIEEKKKEWMGSPAGFAIAIERTQSISEAKETTNEGFIQILSEQLKKIAAEDELLESLSLVNSNPLQVVTKIMDQERVDNVAMLAPIVVRDIQHVIEHMSDKPTLVDYSKNVQALDQFVVNVRSACNRAALINLYDRLEQSTNKQIAEKMISNWDVIGTDIRDSERMMTESDKLRIIAYAQGKKTKQEYEEEMSKLNVKLERGEITAQEEVVIKMFPKLKKALTRLPKEYFADFSLVLKRAFVHQQITHPEKFLQNPHESAVFTDLALDPSKIKVNKELVQQKIKHVLQNLVLNGQAEHEIPTLKELQHQIDLLALKEKIIAAGGESSLTPLIHILTKARQEIIAEATHLLEQEYEQCKKELCDSNPSISQHVDSCLKRSQNKWLQSFYRYIDKKIKENKDSLAGFTDQYDQIKAILSPLTDNTSSQIRTRMLDDVKKDLAFFNQWGDPIQYENIQGFIGGTNEILGEGVCQANTYRVITREMTSLARNQVLSDSQWRAEVKISPQDRYNQALYQINIGEVANNGLSRAVLKRLHLKKIQALHSEFNYAEDPAFSADALYQILSKAVVQQQNSKLKNYGIVKISIGHHTMKKDGDLVANQASWGHAIYLRYDPKKKTAYFFDPNHGRSINFYTWKKLESDVDFKKMKQKEQDETVQNYMLMCFSQMIVRDFNDINTVGCFEMEMDSSLIDKLFSAGNTLVGGLNNFFKKQKENHSKTDNLIEQCMAP